MNPLARLDLPINSCEIGDSALPRAFGAAACWTTSCAMAVKVPLR